MFDRREEAYSPTAGVHQGPDGAKEAFDVVFHAFADNARHTEALVIDGDHVAQS